MQVRWLVVAGVLAAATEARADRMSEILDKPAFTATPAELLEAAKLAPASDASMVVLREDYESSLDDRGRMAARSRRVSVVRAQAGIAAAGAMSQPWWPGHQDRPTFRARVIAPDGTVAELDPSQASDAPLHTTALGATDKHLLRAPLPKLQVGAVIEQELVKNDREARFDAGYVHDIILGWREYPVRSARVTVSAPTGRVVHRANRLPAGATPVRTVAGGRERWTYAIGSIAPLGTREPDMPGDVGIMPVIETSTASSWKAVATAYRPLVDRRIAESPVALPAGIARTPHAIVAWTHSKVRTTGFGLDEVTHVPETPAGTLKRGAGSSLDVATLLVALLRQAGMRADVALIDDAGLDVDRAVPGLGVFDRALVRVRDGARDVWIDPSEELAAPGFLPNHVRGRSALVIADDTTDLVATPASTSADHTVREVRSFEVAEFGRATRVTEAARYTGALELETRQAIRDTRPEELRKRHARYAERHYGGTLERSSSTPAGDVAIPLEQTIVTALPDTIIANYSRIDIWLYPRSTLAWLPEVVEDAANAPRRHDFVWPVPQTVEIENRIPIPEGFTLPALPADEVRPLGTASLLMKYRLDARTVVATMRFDSGKVRVTPAELATLRREIKAANDLDVHLTSEPTSSTLADQGKYREAIVEIERLIALHPKESLHHRQLALVLLRAGMGAPAQRAARRAVAVEPGNAHAHHILGWVLEHDAFSRRRRPDIDRTGALAAYAKARKLDPKLISAAREHAQLLQTGANGVEFDRGCDLAAAAEAWRARLAIEDDDDAADSLSDVLMRQGDGAGAAKVLAPRTGERRDLLLVAATALASGAPAAIKAVDGMRSGVAPRKNLLDEAASYLMRARHHTLARELFTASGKLAAEPEFAVAVSHMKRMPLPAPGDVAALAIELNVMPFDHTVPFAAFADATVEQAVRTIATLHEPNVRSQVGRSTTDLMRDVVAASAEATATIAGAVTRADVKPRPGAPPMPNPYIAYFVREGGADKLIGISLTTDSVGRAVQRLLARKDDAGAMQLLDWLAADLPGAMPAAGPLGTVWGGKSPRDRDGASLAAALLVEENVGNLPILERCAGRTGTTRELCDWQIARTLSRANRPRELDAHATAWAARSADPDGGAGIVRGTALVALGRGREAETIADALLAKRPDLVAVHRLRAYISTFAGALPEAIQRWDAMVAKSEREALNESAWLRLAAETELTRAHDLAKQAVGKGGPARAPAAISDTLAAIRAELGDVRGAMDVLIAALSVRDTRPGDFYVHGRIAEHLGLRDDAIAAYRRVVSPDTIGGAPNVSSQALAKRRLARMGVK